MHGKRSQSPLHTGTGTYEKARGGDRIALQPPADRTRVLASAELKVNSLKKSASQGIVNRLKEIEKRNLQVLTDEEKAVVDDEPYAVFEFEFRFMWNLRIQYKNNKRSHVQAESSDDDSDCGSYQSTDSEPESRWLDSMRLKLRHPDRKRRKTISNTSEASETSSQAKSSNNTADQKAKVDPLSLLKSLNDQSKDLDDEIAQLIRLKELENKQKRLLIEQARL